MSRGLDCSTQATEIAQRMIQLIQEGKIRNHKLKNMATQHSGEIEEMECKTFCDFLPTKNFNFLLELRGCDNHE